MSRQNAALVTAAQRQALLAAACAARAAAYAPYSHYTVGAALLAEDGQIYTGVNVENASYGLTVCAERTAIGTLIGSGQRRIRAMAVCTVNGGSPCGACRQVLREFAPLDAPVYLSDAAGDVHTTTVGELLPRSFGPEHLP